MLPTMGGQTGLNLAKSLAEVRAGLTLQCMPPDHTPQPMVILSRTC